MHIFITGVAGFLGSNLADYYLKKGFKVSGCDNLVGGYLGNVHPDVVFYKGNCEQTRCFSDIDDCIYCLDKLMTDKHIFSETVNIGPDEESITMNELFKKIANKLQFNKEPEYFLDRPNEVKHATCSSDKARKILNYKTTVTLDESIDKVVNFIKKNGTKKFQYNYALEIQNEKTPKTWKEKIF